MYLVDITVSTSLRVSLAQIEELDCCMVTLPSLSSSSWRNSGEEAGKGAVTRVCGNDWQKRVNEAEDRRTVRQTMTPHLVLVGHG
jgi:hypothetical protein